MDASVGRMLYLASLVLVASCVAPATDSRLPRAFVCGNAFAPDTTEARLATAFGEANVVTTEIHVVEDFFEQGTVIFGDTEDRIEILWKDPEARNSPRMVRARGERSSWKTPHGLTLGLDLRSIQAINGRPFQLYGFAWDFGGTVHSWEQGNLDGPPGATCLILARLSPDFSNLEWDDLLIGTEIFSSEHHQMQLANPTIYELLLIFP